MRPLAEKAYSNCPSRTRSAKDYGRPLQLSDAKERNGAGLIPQDRTVADDSVMSVHEGQTQVETLDCGTQVLDDFTDGFGSELDDALEDCEDTLQAQRRSLEGEVHVSNEYKDENGTVLEDIGGDTQILDDPEVVSHSEKNENGYCKENFSTQILDDQLCTEDLVTASNIRINGGTGNGSSKEMDRCKSSINYLTDATVDHISGTSANSNDDTSGYAPSRFTEIRRESMQASAAAAAAQSRSEKQSCELRCSTSTNTNQSSQKPDEKDTKTSGRVPLRFTEIRVEAWIAYGLEVKKRALSANTIGAVCSAGKSPAKQNHVDKVNDKSVKGSPSNMEGTDDEHFTAFSEAKDRDFGNDRKVKSSAVRKLFAEESVPQTEACGIIFTGDDESEPAARGCTDAARLSYIESQESNDLAQAEALDFVEKFLTDNLSDIDTNDRGSTRLNNTKAVDHSNCKQSLVKKSIFRSTVGFSKAFDWDDNNEDEGGGAFFCKLKEKSSKKESHFVRSAPPIQKFNPANSEELDKGSKQSKADVKKRKLTYSDTGIVSKNMKKTARNVEGNAKENVIEVANQEHCIGNNASHQNTPDMPIAGKDVSAVTSSLKELQAGLDTYQLNTKEKGPSEGFSMGQTRKGSYIKVHNTRKKARHSSNKVSNISAQSKPVPTGWEGTSGAAPTQNQEADFIELPMEIPACAGRNRESGNGQIPTVVPSGGGSSVIDPGQMGQVVQIKPTQSNHKASSISNSVQAHQMLNKRSILRRSCRLNKITKFEDHMQFNPTTRNKIVGDPMDISTNQLDIPRRRSHRLNGSSTLEDLLVQNVNKQASAGATEEQHSHADFGTSVRDTAHKLETSPRGRAYIPSSDCGTPPTNSVQLSEEASPVCMGNEYYKISCYQNLPGSDPKKEVNNFVTFPRKLTSGLKDSRKRRVMTEVRVLFSRHLDESTIMHQKKILERLGASLASSLSEATHFIADKFVRTKNMLEAIALGKPVVTPLWLVSCCETRCHIDENSYILRDVKKEKEFGFSMPVSLDSARQQPLLRKRRVFITPNTKPGKEVIACLVKAVGGQVMGRITWSALKINNGGDHLLILTCEEDFAICEPFMEKDVKVYSSELLLNGIVTQRLEFERYRLFGDCGKRITRHNGRMKMRK